VSDLMRDRYGADRPVRRRVTVAVAGLAALVGLVWLGWAVWFQSTPDVQSSLRSFAVRGPHAATAEVDVRLRDSRVRATCLLRAYAADHSIVGELDVRVPAGRTDRTLHPAMRTERRAISVDLVGCTTPHQLQPR
jgi:hypothetical protein